MDSLPERVSLKVIRSFYNDFVHALSTPGIRPRSGAL